MLLIDKMSSKPVYEQIIDGIERNILLGVYLPGSVLPSLRELSVMLSINPNTIQKSYGELTRRGVICPSPGSGCYVAYNALDILKARAAEKLSEIRSLTVELRMAGIPKGDVLATVAEVYAGDPINPNTKKDGGNES